MIQVKHIDPDDLALYAMQLLLPEEMAEMRIHLQHSAEARKVLADYLADLAIVAHTAEMHSPPAQTRQRLMKHVAREKKIVPVHLLDRALLDRAPLDRAPLDHAQDTLAPREKPSLIEMEPVKKGFAARALPWLGWAVAAGMLLPVINSYQQSELLRSTVAADQRQLAETQVNSQLMDTMLGTAKDPDAVHVKLTSTGTPPPPEGRAAYVASKGALLFVASNLTPLEEAKVYELWVVPKGGAFGPIPAGTFKPDADGNAHVMLPALPKGIEAAAIAVTIEPDGGSETPTKPLILQGATAGE